MLRATIPSRLLISSFLILLFTSPVFAATVTVTSTADSGAGSLRQAIADAASGDTITFNLAYPATITLASELAFSKSLAIDGPGQSLLTVSGGGTTRIFNISGGTVSIAGLTVTQGHINGTTAAGAGFYVTGSTSLTFDGCDLSSHLVNASSSNRGGAIYWSSTGTLTLNHCYVHNNTASGATSYNDGAGLWMNQGALSVANSSFAANSCGGWGSAIFTYASSTLVNTTVCGNVTNSRGAIVAIGPITLINCTVANNTSGQNESGLSEQGGQITLRNTVIAGNASNVGYSDINAFAGGTIQSLGYNLIGSQGGLTFPATTGDLVGTESAKVPSDLAALADNGGYVPTMLPNGSRVIDPAGNTVGPWVDARGYLRTNPADKGACESSAALPTAIPPTAIQINGFTAAWNAVAGASGYLLDVATDSGFANMVTGYRNRDAGNGTRFDVTGLTSGVTYYYRIRAYNGTYPTWYSNTVTWNFANPTATVTPTSTASPTFTASPTLTATPTVTPTSTATPTASMTSTASPTATPTSTVSPTATRSATSTVTPTITKTATITPTGTATPTVMPSGDNSVRAFPNPASGLVHFAFSLEQAGNVRVVLYNLASERVAELSGELAAGNSELAWDCRGAAPGLYFVRVKMNGVEKRLKLAIVR